MHQLNLPEKIAYCDRIALLLRACKPNKDKKGILEHRKIVEEVANRFIEESVLHKSEFNEFFKKCGVSL